MCTRTAPTPSGPLHLGNAVNFLVTWALARSRGGEVLLRVNDRALHVRSTTPYAAHLAAAHIYNSAGILVAALPVQRTGDTTIEVRLPRLTAGLYVIALATNTLPSKHLGSSLFIVSE